MPASRKTTSTTRVIPRGPLVFNTRNFARGAGEEHRASRVVPAPEGLGAGMATVPAGADITLDVRFESVTEGILVTVAATAPLVGECARCLEPVNRSMEIRCQELFSYVQADGDGEQDGYSLDGDLLDLGPVLRDALVLSLPLAPRCRDDCPGLCVQCGVPLARAGREHTHDSIDPRWEKLRDFAAEARQDGASVPETSEESGRGRP